MRREDIKEAAINYDSRLVAFRAFMKGAEWRINSVWHDANEQPDRGKDIIVMYSNKSCRVFLPNGIWDNLIKVDKFIKWAYIEDLLPNTED
ncbi:MAG: hypothetical protein ACLTFX_00405 [Phocaeicola vulgatus]